MWKTDHIVMYPSRSNYTIVKQKIVIAKLSLELIKRKLSALSVKFEDDKAKLVLYKSHVEEVMNNAFESMAKARFLSIDFKPVKVMDMDRADIYMSICKECTAGICVPIFKLNINEATSCPFVGLSRGGEQVDIIRAAFQDAIKVLENVATLEFGMKTIQIALKGAQTREKSLEQVLIPIFQNTLNYIAEEFNELERDEFYRMKCAQAKQRKRVKCISQLKKERDKIALLKARGRYTPPYDSDSSDDEKRRRPPKESSEVKKAKQLARDKANRLAERINKRARKKKWLQRREEKRIKEAEAEAKRLKDIADGVLNPDGTKVSEVIEEAKDEIPWYLKNEDNDEENANEVQDAESEEDTSETNKDKMKKILMRFMKK